MTPLLGETRLLTFAPLLRQQTPIQQKPESLQNGESPTNVPNVAKLHAGARAEAILVSSCRTEGTFFGLG